MTGDQDTTLPPAGAGDAVPEGRADPSATVMQHDACFGDGWLDISRWTGTVFFPLALISTGGSIVIEDAEAFAIHLRKVHDAARVGGAVGFRTHITGQRLPAPNMAIVTGHRDRMNAAGQVLTSTSMTWSLILTPDGWRTNQIHFNDSRNDPSIVSDMLRETGERE